MPHTLLLADDSVTIRRVIELTFADEDIRVVSVGDGQQAIDRIRAEPPDIVLADTGMPERDGYEVAAFIKTDPDLASIPVVLLTGAFERVDGDRAKQAACDAVLVKPLEPQVVIKRVRGLLADAAAPVATSESADAQDREPDSALPRDFARPTLVVEPKPDETLDIHRPPQEDPETPAEPPAAEGLSGEDDPLGSYLDRVDEALDRLDSGAPPVEPARAATTPADEVRPLEDPAVVDSLEGALTALEGALDKLSLEPVDPVEAVPTADDGHAVETAGESLETPDDSSSMSPSDTEPVSEPVAEPVVEPVVEPLPQSLAVPAPESDLLETEVVLPPDGESIVQDSSVVTPPSEPDAAPVVFSAATDLDAAPLADTPAEPTEPAQGAPPVSTPPRQVTSAPPPAAGPPPTRAAPPSLADAFASLLAAEQGDADRARTLYPWAAAPTPAGADEELIERVTEQVLARLSDTVSTELVTQVVASVAERLVRAELDRLKQ